MDDPTLPAPASGRARSLIPRERIDHATELYVSGRSSVWCQRRLCERWGVSPRQARRYLELARERYKQLPQPDPTEARELAARQLQAAFDIAASRGDAKAMVLAACRLAELHGAIGPQRVEISTKPGAPIGVVLLPVLGEGDATNSG